jgi:hypothetical protein
VPEHRRKSDIEEENEEEEEEDEPSVVLVAERIRRPYSGSPSQQEAKKVPEQHKVPFPTTTRRSYYRSPRSRKHRRYRNSAQYRLLQQQEKQMCHMFLEGYPRDMEQSQHNQCQKAEHQKKLMINQPTLMDIREPRNIKE